MGLTKNYLIDSMPEYNPELEDFESKQKYFIPIKTNNKNGKIQDKKRITKK